MQGFFDRVYGEVMSIPRGKVLTYADVARMCGAPRMSRQVGWALHVNPRPGVIPCHRVVFADGSLSAAFAFGGESAQRELLAAEGVGFSGDLKVDLKKYRWVI